MKFVYLIQSLSSGYYKIGVSKHPNIRLSQLQTGNSSILKLITTYGTEFSNLIEKTLHRKYSYLKKEGEWFDLSINIELSFTDECNKIEQNIIILKKSGNIFM